MTKRTPIYTATIACTPYWEGAFCYTVNVYNADYTLRVSKTFDYEDAAQHYAKQFWSF